ncbi:MAG: S1C family serine protease [Proteobacteria bacterium]|nr:S1C family serine protease [Pseudomonadota bacterium]
MTLSAKHGFQSKITPLKRGALLAALATALMFASPDTNAQSGSSPGPQEILEAVVGIDTRIPGTARTARTLGTQREGSGVVISDDGLVLTIGYLILEAIEIDIALADGRRIPASFVAYDHESGFGLVRAASDLGLAPVRLGTSGDMGVSTQVLLANRLGPESAQGVFVVDRREFVGAWEYLLDSAIFTSPPNPNFSGAGLFDADGKLIGIGSLFVGNAAFFQRPVAGNMFVPIDELKPILDEMVEQGRRAAAPRPWLGIRTSELRDRLFVDGVSDDSPAARAGVRAGDLIVAVDAAPVASMAGYFRAVWRDRAAGDAVTVRVLTPEGALRDIEIESMDRNNWLRLDPSL